MGEGLGSRLLLLPFRLLSSSSLAILLHSHARSFSSVSSFLLLFFLLLLFLLFILLLCVFLLSFLLLSFLLLYFLLLPFPLLSSLPSPSHPLKPVGSYWTGQNEAERTGWKGVRVGGGGGLRWSWRMWAEIGRAHV